MFLGATVISEGILVSEAQERGLSPQGLPPGLPRLLSPSLTGDGGVAGRLGAQ